MAQVLPLRATRVPEARLGRTVALGWALVVAPLAAVALAALASGAEPERLHCAGAVKLRGPVRYARVGTDASGDLVVVSDGAGAVYQIDLSHQRVRSRLVYAPRPSRELWATALALVATAPDRPLTLVPVTLMRGEEPDVWPALGEGPLPPKECPRFAPDSTGRLVYRGSGPAPVDAIAADGPTEVVGFGRSLGLKVMAGVSCSTMILDRGQCIQCLTGRVVAAGDMDGDGDQEVLTAAQAAPDAPSIIPLRLYSVQGRRYREVWHGSTSVPVEEGEAAGLAPLAMLADLDGDCRDELVVCDGLTGRLTVWVWDAEA